MMNFHHHRWGFPCCVCFPVCACCRHYPGRTNGSCSLVLSHPLRPSPRERRVGSCIALFEACSTFNLVTACTLTESLFTTLYTEGSSDFVASTAASVVTGWNEPVPGRVYLPLKNTAFHGALSPLRSPGFPVESRGVDQHHAVFLRKTAHVVVASSAK